MERFLVSTPHPSIGKIAARIVGDSTIRFQVDRPSKLPFLEKVVDFNDGSECSSLRCVWIELELHES